MRMKVVFKRYGLSEQSYQRFIVACCAILWLWSVNAQTVIKEMDGANTRFIPGNYMKNGEAAIYFSDDEYGYHNGSTEYEAKIFDFELNPLKSFYFQIFHPYSVIESRATSGNMEKTKVLTEELGEISGFPPVTDIDARKAAFIQYIFEYNRYLDPSMTLDGLAANCRVDGTTIYIALPNALHMGMYNYYEYLRCVEIYFDASNKYGYSYTYATQVPICNGEWTKVTWYDVPVSNFCTPKCNDVVDMNHWNGGVYLPFSQTFFNDDEKFEYVRYKAELVEGESIGGIEEINPDDNIGSAEYLLFGITATDRDGDGEDDYRKTYYGVRYTGLEVVSEDGNVIYSFPIPDNCDGSASIEFFKSNDHILAQADFHWYNEKNEYMHTVRFYRIDKTSGVAKIVHEEKRLSACPNPVSVGTPVEMELPVGQNGSRAITVTSLSGSRVFSQLVERGATKISIPTHYLSPGMYMFTLTENGQSIDTCKIIIR